MVKLFNHADISGHGLFAIGQCSDAGSVLPQPGAPEIGLLLGRQALGAEDGAYVLTGARFIDVLPRRSISEVYSEEELRLYVALAGAQARSR
jgi:hypothetical protein